MCEVLGCTYSRDGHCILDSDTAAEDLEGVVTDGQPAARPEKNVFKALDRVANPLAGCQKRQEEAIALRAH